MTRDAPPSCPDCDGTMTEGFLLDETYGGRHPAYWIEGAPEKSLFLGTKLRGRAIYVTETYRCTACGRLASYARTRRR